MLIEPITKPRMCFWPLPFPKYPAKPARCKRPSGHRGPCAVKPWPDDEITTPSYEEVQAAYRISRLKRKYPPLQLILKR